MSTRTYERLTAVPDDTHLLVLGQHTHRDVTVKISGLVLRAQTSRTWWILFSMTSLLLTVLPVAIAVLLRYGVGVG